MPLFPDYFSPGAAGEFADDNEDGDRLTAIRLRHLESIDCQCPGNR